MSKTDKLLTILSNDREYVHCFSLDELLVKSEDVSMEKHDEKYHPDGYKEGEECKFREKFNEKIKEKNLLVLSL